jgi:hypothetical protein
MKAKTTLLAVGLFGALQAAVFAESTNLTAAATEPKPLLQPVYPPVDYRLDLQKPGTENTNADTIQRYDRNRISSQAWTTIATRNENPTLAHDVSIHESQLVLLSLPLGGKSAGKVKIGH